MKMTKRILSGVLAVVSVFSFTACGNDDDSTASTTLATLDSDQQQVVEDVASTLPDIELANKTVKFLGHYDINPTDEGAVMPADLAMFQEKYGGKVERVTTTWEARYTDLANYVAGNKSPDLFPANDMDGFPKGAIKNMFQPIDDYFDFSQDYWQEMTSVLDMLMYEGKHYIAATGVAPASVCIYNRNVIAENGLEDPATLFAQGNWNWDTFEEMCLAFTNPEEDKYALDGWAVEQAIFNSAGVPLIGLEDGKLVSNYNDPTIEKVANFMYDIQKNKVLYPRHEINNWSIRGGSDGVGMKEGLLLFCPIGLWGIEGANTAQYGDVANGDVMFVPMPKDPDSDEYPIWTNAQGYLFIQGAPNPEGAAAFINCTMVAGKDEATKALYLDQLMNDFGWTQEMVDMKDTMVEMCKENPMFDFSGGVTDKIGQVTDDSRRTLMIPGETTWAEQRSTYADAVQILIDEANAEFQQ